MCQQCVLLVPVPGARGHRRNPERHECRNHRARRETVQGAAGQAGHDAGAAHREGEDSVSILYYS